MSALTLQDAAGRRLLTVTVTRVLTGSAVLLPAVVAIVVTWRASGAEAPWWPVPVLAGLLAAAVAVPDSGLPAFVVAGIGAWWLAAVRGPSVGATLLVAACLMAFHVASAHAAAGPPGCEPSGAVVRSLLVRTLGVLAITAGLAVTALLVDDASGAPPVLVAVSLVVVAALPWALARR